MRDDHVQLRQRIQGQADTEKVDNFFQKDAVTINY